MVQPERRRRSLDELLKEGDKTKPRQNFPEKKQLPNHKTERA